MCFIFVLHFDGLILCSCTQINARIVFCKISQIRIGFGFSSTQVSDFFFPGILVLAFLGLVC